MYDRRRSKFGFTLIELMITVTIIGILAMVAIPKFADMSRRAREAQTKGSLGTIRSALTIYYSDMEGLYPTDRLESLTVDAKYIVFVPNVWVPNYHVPICDTSGCTVLIGPSSSSVSQFYQSMIEGPGLPAWWVYFHDVTNPGTYGWIGVDCLHTDTKGTSWSSY
jgi:prepilin-type N-terminal cleavage/methylation domain-containing protein